MPDLDLVQSCRRSVGVCRCLGTDDVYFIGGYCCADIGEEPLSVAANYLQSYRVREVFV